MRRLGETRVMTPHLFVFVNLDAWHGRTEAQSLFRIEREGAQFLDFFDIDQMLGAADPGSQLQNVVGATPERASGPNVGFWVAGPLIKRAWHSAINSVRG